MGLPYSKQINAAFEQVTPLVAEGYKTLDTIKNISILLSVIQVLTVFLLSGILFTLLGILVILTPELEQAKELLVLPAMRVLTDVLLRVQCFFTDMILPWILVTVGIAAVAGAGWGWMVMRGPGIQEIAEDVTEEDLEGVKKDGEVEKE